MGAITRETRRESHEKIKPFKPTRKKQILRVLAGNSFTANELAEALFEQKLTKDSARNNVHPRLTEMVSEGKIEEKGKRQCAFSGRTCTIYEVSKQIEFNL